VERTLVIRRLESDSGLRIRARNPAPRAKGIIA
jgi:hypothetical protein